MESGAGLDSQIAYQVSLIDNGNLALREGWRASELTKGSMLDLGTQLGLASSSPSILRGPRKRSAGDQTVGSGSKGRGLVSESCEWGRSARRCGGRRQSKVRDCALRVGEEKDK